MKIKHTILALVIVAVLGGTFYYLDRQPERPGPDAVPKEKLFSFTADQVEEFTIENPPEPAATFRRATSTTAPAPATPPAGGASEKPAPQWEIVTPAGIVANSALIQSFVEELPSFQMTPLAGETAAPVWSEYGLDQPQRTVRIKLKDGKEITIAVGKANPGGNARYGRRDNAAPVLLLDTGENRSLLEKKLFDLRDTRVLPIDFSQATRLEIRFRGNRPRVVITKQANDNWQLEPRLRTDYTTSSYLVTMLTGATMSTVEEETDSSLAKYGLTDPEVRLEITTPQGVSSLIVSNKKKEGDQELFYAKNSVWPYVFTLPRVTYNQLNQEMDTYRSRYLFDFDTYATKRLEISGGPAGNLVFGKRGEEWFKAGSPETKMESSRVEDFLNGIHSLRIAAFPSDQPNRLAAYGLNDPWMRMKVVSGDQNQEETILFARRNDKFYAARQGEPSVYEMSSGEPGNIESKLKELTAAAPGASGPPSPHGP